MFPQRLLQHCVAGCVLVMGLVAQGSQPITYQTHIHKIFRNYCQSCHRGSRAKAGLDLSSYQSVLEGSSSGSVLVKGDPADSILYLCMTHEQEPSMPPGKDRLGEDILQVVETWIKTGLPETPVDVTPTKRQPNLAQADPAQADPAQAQATMAKPDQIQPDQTQPDQTQPDQTQPDQTQSDEATFKTAKATVDSLVDRPEPFKAELLKAEPLKAEPLKQQPAKFQPGKPKGIATESASSRLGGLAVSPVLRGARPAPVTALAVSPSGKWAALGGQLQVLIFDLANGQLRGVLPFPEGEVFQLRFRSDSKQLLASGGTHAESGKVILWDLLSAKRVQELGDEFDVVLAADLSPDGQTVLLGGPDRVVKIIEVASGRTRGTLTKHTDWILDARFSPEGLIFTTADRAGNVFVWETESTQLLHTLRGHQGAVTSIAWSADGDTCLTGGADGTVRLWDMHTGKRLRQWTAHPGGVLDLQRTPSGDFFSVGRDNTAKCWSAEGKLRQKVSADSLPVKVATVGKSRALLGTWSGRVLSWSFDQPTLQVALLVDEQLLTSGIEAIVQEVVLAPQAESPARAGDTARTATAATASTPAQEAVVAANRLRILSEKLPDAAQRMRAAEADLDEARQMVKAAEKQIKSLSQRAESEGLPQAEDALAQEVERHLSLRNRVAGLVSLIDSLTAAVQLAETIDSDSPEARESAMLSKIARQKALAALKVARQQEQTSDRRIREASEQLKTLSSRQQTISIQQATADLAQAQEKLEKAQRQWTSASSLLKDMHKQIDQVADALTRSQERFGSLEGQLQNLSSEIAELEDRLSAHPQKEAKAAD